MEILFVIIFIAVGVVVYRDGQYKKGAYYQITKNSYSDLNKGKYGEYLIYKRLKSFEEDGGKFLFNIYIPKENDKVTEIDALLLCRKGLFVFESKNYSGWIFGHEGQKNWTQTLPIGRGRTHKERFYNPIMQNETHIRHLKRFIGDNIPMWSIIVFSDECTLKDITIKSPHVHVTNLYYASSVVTKIYNQTQDTLSETEIRDIYNKLFFRTIISDELKEQHVKNAQQYKTNS